MWRVLNGLVVATLLVLSGCGDVPAGGGEAEGPRVLTMGDSMLAWNAASGRSVADVLEDRLGTPVTDRSVSAARVLYALPISGALGMEIAQQYVAGDWDWVVLNGGGNDLWLGCGCSGCERRMARMISEDGTEGAIPALVAKLRESGARVLYLGYLRTPGHDSPIDHCAADGDALEARLEKMAARDRGVRFVSLRDLVPMGDLSFHAPDRIHPSPKGSAAIAARVARVIARRP
jgi:lysophospholipase L1-like esterase